MPKKRRGPRLGRNAKGGKQKNSTTAHLHHLSSSYEGNNNDTNNEVVAGGSNNKSTKKKQQKKRNANLQLSNDRLKNKVKKLKQQHEEKEEVFNDWKAKSRKAIKGVMGRSGYLLCCITVVKSLYACGASSLTLGWVSHTIPSMASSNSCCDIFECAFVRDILRPAP